MDVTGLGFQRGETPFEKQPPLVIETESLFNPIGKSELVVVVIRLLKIEVNIMVRLWIWSTWVIKVCYHYQIPFISFKYISDGADDNANDDWDENVSKGIEVFKKEILEKLK